MPIYLRTGKALNTKSTRIVVEFKEVPKELFAEYGNIEKNRIILDLQPPEGIDIHFNVKVGGDSKKVREVHSRFENISESKEAYEKLLEDIVQGDKTLFASADMLEETWRLVDDLINCKVQCPFLHIYKKGSNGPEAAD